MNSKKWEHFEDKSKYLIFRFLLYSIKLELKIAEKQDEWVKLMHEEISKIDSNSSDKEEARKKIEEKFQQHALKKELDDLNTNKLPKLGWIVNNRYPFLEIPTHLRDFSKKQLPNWIKNALAAKYSYSVGKHYDVSASGKIIPIDYSNTGVLHDNMVKK